MHAGSRPAGDRSLAGILRLESTGPNEFTAAARTHAPRRKFGGETMGQATVAAAATVEPGRPISSVHTTFLRSATTAEAVTYSVHDLRDGSTMTTRRVEAWQGDRRVAECLVTFHVSEDGLSHADPIEPLPEISDVPPAVSQFADDARGLEWYLDLTDRGAVEMRFPGGPHHKRVLAGETTPPSQSLWVRSAAPLADCDDSPERHEAAVVYVSDYFMLALAGMHHGVVQQPGTLVATLSHTVWFHGSARADEWLLHRQHSPWAGHGRALTRGRLYATDGRLVASTMQEGIIRRTAQMA
jgi:acyl-CoA thioesterase II